MNTSGLKPIGYFVLVVLDDNEGKVGSIYMPPSVQDKDAMSTQEGTICALGPHAFNWVDSWPDGTQPQIGQRVLFKRHGGHFHERDGRKYRVLNDKDDLIAIIEEPPALSAAAA